jgi:hypothetical protein
MRGAGAVTINRDVVYVYFTVAGRTARLRLSADECDRLDLFAGRQVRVGLGGQEPVGALVVGVVPAPPFVWVEVELAAPFSRAG